MISHWWTNPDKQLPAWRQAMHPKLRPCWKRLISHKYWYSFSQHKPTPTSGSITWRLHLNGRGIYDGIENIINISKIGLIHLARHPERAGLEEIVTRRVNQLVAIEHFLDFQEQVEQIRRYDNF